MIRAIAVIVSAILMSRPTMPKAEATRYAHLVAEEAKKHDFDPLTAVAIVHFESRWQPWVVSADGEDWGLGQIRARFLGPCREDEDPVNAPSAGCLAAKRSLLVPEVNLRRMSSIITANRELCKEKTGAGDLPRWLAGYEGLNRPSRDVWCKPSPKTWEVVAYRRMLVDTLVAKKRPVAVAKRGDPKAVSPKSAAATPKAAPPRQGGASPKPAKVAPKQGAPARRR